MTEYGERRAIVLRVLFGGALLFSIIQLGVTWLTVRLDFTTSALLGSLAMLSCALLLERSLFAQPGSSALSRLGFVRPRPAALVVSVLIGLPMLAFFPVTSHLTGISIRLKSDWLWVLVGAIALNGIAEETLFRGWIFGHLRRRAGLGFMRAGLISMGIFVAVHLILFIGNPPVIALGATLVAVAASFPMAYLFERGNDSIWAPVVLHVAAHAVRLFDIPPPIAMNTMLAWLGIQIGAGFLVFAFRGLLAEPPRR